MYRLKTPTGYRLWAREVGSLATDVTIRAGVLKSHGAPCPPAVRPHCLNSGSQGTTSIGKLRASFYGTNASSRSHQVGGKPTVPLPSDAAVS